MVAGWGGGCTGSSSTCVMEELRSDATITAKFIPVCEFAKMKIIKKKVKVRSKRSIAIVPVKVKMPGKLVVKKIVKKNKNIKKRVVRLKKAKTYKVKIELKKSQESTKKER